MGPLKPYAIGRRPGGYRSLRQRPYGLFGEPAWNSLGEYRRTAGVDSEMPPGKPSDVTRVDHARPRDAALGYEPMPSGQKAAGLGQAINDLRSAFSGRAGAMRNQSVRSALGINPAPPGGVPGGPTTWGGRGLSHATADPADIKSLFGQKARDFYANWGPNRSVANTPENRLKYVWEPQGNATAQRLAGGGLEDEALRHLTNRTMDPSVRMPPPRPPMADAPFPIQNWAPGRLSVPRTNFKLLEGLGLAGATTAAGAGLYGAHRAGLFNTLGNAVNTAAHGWADAGRRYTDAMRDMVRRDTGMADQRPPAGDRAALPPGATPWPPESWADPNAAGPPQPASPAPETPAPGPETPAPQPQPQSQGRPPQPGNQLPLGDWANAAYEHVQAHPWQYGLGAGALGLGGLYLWDRQRQEEEERERELEEAYLDKSGAAVPLAAAARDCPTAAGVLAYCAQAGYNEAEIRHTIIKAAGVVPALADEFERLFGVAAGSCERAGDGVIPPRVKRAFGEGYNGTPTPQPTPQPPAPTPLPKATAPTPLPRPPAPAPPPATRPLPADTNAVRAYAQGNSPQDQGAMRGWRQQLQAAERAGDQATAARLRAQMPRPQAQGLAAARQNAPLQTMRADLAHQAARQTVDEGAWQQYAGATTEQLGRETGARADILNNRGALLAQAGLRDGTPEARRYLQRQIDANSTQLSRPEWDTAANAQGRMLSEVPEAAGALRTMPMALGADLTNLGRGDPSFRWTRGNVTELADPLHRGLGVDPFRRLSGAQGTFGGLDPLARAEGTGPAAQQRAQNSLAQEKGQQWADWGGRQDNRLMAGAGAVGSALWSQAPLAASMYGMAGLKAPVPEGATGLGSAPAWLSKVPLVGNQLRSGMNALTATRSAAPYLRGLPGFAQAEGALGGVGGRGLQVASSALPALARGADKQFGAGALKWQAGSTTAQAAMGGDTGIAPKAAPSYVESLDQEALDGLRGDPARLQATRSEGHQGITDFLERARSDPNFDANRAQPALEGPVRNLIAARCAQSGEDPQALMDRYAQGGITPNEAMEIAGMQGKGGPGLVDQVTSFFQDTGISPIMKMLVGVGVPMGALGLLASLLGGGGLGGLLVGALGLGAAAFGGQQSGALRGTGLGGMIDSVTGSLGLAGTPGAGAGGGGGAPPAGAGGQGGVPLTPAQRKLFMGSTPEARADALKEQLARNPEWARKFDMASMGWNVPVVGRGLTATAVRQFTGMPDLGDDEIAAYMDAYARGKGNGTGPGTSQPAAGAAF